VKQFKIGERVAFLREPGGGVVKRIKRNIVFVEDETGFERPFQMKELGKIYGTNYTAPSTENFKENFSTQKKNTSDTIRWYTQYKTYWEIDLHFEEFAERYEHNNIIDDHILNKQLNIFKEIFWLARRKKVRKLIVIHGFGKGILRKEVQLFLIAQEGVEYFDAPYMEYGHGAIQIELRYKY